MRLKIGILILIFALIAAIVVFIYQFVLVNKEIEIKHEASGEALANQFLAAERLLTSMGCPSKSFRDFDELPPTDHMLILTSGKDQFTKAELKKLLDWTEAGGQLMVFVSAVQNLPKPDLSKRFTPPEAPADPPGLEEQEKPAPTDSQSQGPEAVHPLDTPPDLDSQAEAEADAEASELNPEKVGQESPLSPADATTEKRPSNYTPADDKNQVPANLFPFQHNPQHSLLAHFMIGTSFASNETDISYKWPDEDSPLELETGPHLIMSLPDEPEESFWLGVDNSNMDYLWIAHGEGLVHFLAISHCFDNNNIQKADHALFFYHLFHQMDLPPMGAWFIYGEHYPSIATWLKKHAWMPLLCFPLLIAFWLWQISPRFGPIEPDPTPNRRSLVEHLCASGYWLWNHNAREQLLQAPRRAALASLRQNFPGFQPEWDEHIERLAAEKKLPVERVRRALTGTLGPHEQDFIEMIADIEILRRKS